MHRSVLDFVCRALTADDVTGKRVLEVGSRNVNGSIRIGVRGLNPLSYWGVDIKDGEDVDEVVDCVDLTTHFTDTFDVVISTEMLEHAADWRSCVAELAKVTSPGGVLLITTRSPGFQYHNPPDHWRYSYNDMGFILSLLDLEILKLEHDPAALGVFALVRKPAWGWKPKFDSLLDVELAVAKIDSPVEDDSPVEVREINGQKLVVAFPLYQHVSTSFFFNWVQMDTSHVGGVVAVDGSMYLPQKMEFLIAKAYDQCPDFDRLVVMEQDMIVAPDALNRIAQYKDEHDIVGSMYFKHEWPYHIMAWMQVDKPRFSPLTRDVVKIMKENPALYEVDGVAMGFTSIARRVFEGWNPDVSMWTPTPPMVGHDLHFCNEAKKPQHGPNKDQAFKVWLDSGIGCGHLTLVPIGYDHSQEALAEDEPDTWEQVLSRGEMPQLDKVM